MEKNNSEKVGVIIPAYNEELFIEKTIQHLLSQILKPQRIVVVNDGSTDKTREILERFKEIEIVDRKNQKSNIAKKQLATTYNSGLKKFLNDDCKFVMVLDADIILEDNYISEIVSRMNSNPKLAIASGIIEGEYSTEPRGGGRMVRVDFWKKLGLIYPENYGFEGYLLWKAESMGYETGTFYDLIMKTQRKTGATYNPKHYLYYGYGLKALGYSIPYALVRILLFARKKPKGSYYMLKGFLGNYKDLYEPELREYVRKTQQSNILHFNKNYLKRTINLFKH